MTPRLFTLAALLSLALCAGIVWFWFTSYLLGWEGMWDRSSARRDSYSRYAVVISGGGIELSLDRSSYPNAQRFSPETRSWHRTADSDYPEPYYTALKLGHRWAMWWDDSTESSHTETRAGVIFPCWFVFVATAALPGLSFWMRRSRRRFVDLHRCAACGYNLTGNTSGVCPECGADIPAEAKP